LFGQELQAGQFGNQAMLGQNQAQLANLGFTNQAQQADFANQLAGMGFNNQQIQQMYQNQMGQQQANNAIAQQEYANRMAGANLSNQARQQGLQEQAYLRNEPLNTLSAVRTGSQVQGPQFVNSFNQATTQGPDLLGAAGMQYNAQMGDFNAKQAAQQNFNQGLMGLGGAGIMAFSDIRMKENIKQIHWLPNGLPVYEFEYKPEFKDIAGHGKFVGVMAQEAEMVQPEAVITNADGYKMVNYGLLT
jgi:virulence-associated protein VapD